MSETGTNRPKLRLDEIAYGGDYNPEQWDAATVKEDIELMQEAGVNLVSIGIFSWARLEPYPGQYDFDWLAEVIDQLWDAGIHIDLATATASPPAWMAKDYPETLPVNATGQRYGFGSRQQYCHNNPTYLEFARKLVTALAQRFGTHPALRLWHVSNELACHVQHCYCDTCAGAFRSWLEAKYADIEALNQAWGTDFWAQRYTDFDQITPPRLMPTFRNPTQSLDWQRFHSDAWLELYLNEARILREITPDIPVTTNFMGLFQPTNYQEWAGQMDIISDDSYPEPAAGAAVAQVAFEADLMRSLGRRPFLLMEQAPAGIQWRAVNSPKRPGQNKLWSIQRVAQGADGILHFQWRQSKAGAEMFHSGMVPHQGRDSRIFREVVDLGQTLKRLSPVRGEGVSTPVAIFLDWHSEWARSVAIGPLEYRFGEAIRHWHRTVFEAGYCADFVGPNQLEHLGEYRVVVVAQNFASRPEVVEALRRAAEGGTQVVIAAPTGVVDMDLHAHLINGAGAMGELAGVRVVEQWPTSVPLVPGGQGRADLYADPHPAVDQISAAVGAPSELDHIDLEALAPGLVKALEEIATPRPDLRGRVWAELLEIDPEVEVVANFLPAGAAQDLAGHGAITRRCLGDGAVTYTAVDLDPIGRAALLRYACAHAGLARPRADLPAGVQRVERGGVTFLLNHSDQAVELGGYQGRDLVGDQDVSGHLVLAPRSAAAIIAN